MSFRIINGKVVPVDMPSPSKSGSKVETGTNFNDIFQNELNKTNAVKISGHALERLKRRNIELDSTDMQKLTDAIDKADAKGARESLLLYKDTAFIASIRNKTIITAIDSDSAKDNVFTNIDSAVIISWWLDLLEEAIQPPNDRRGTKQIYKTTVGVDDPVHPLMDERFISGPTESSGPT